MGDPALWLTEGDVVALVDLATAGAAVRDVLVSSVLAPSVLAPSVLAPSVPAKTMDKTSIVFGEGDTLHALGGATGGLAGTKTWVHTRGGATPLLVLWDSATGSLRAVIEAFALGQLRTAAMSSVATDVLADPTADVLAVIGTGKQALAQVAAVAAARRLRSVRIYSPTEAHRSAFAADLAAAGLAPAGLAAAGTSADLVTCDSVADAVRGATIVTTVTRARDPFLQASMLSRRVHVNAVGAISPERRELADDVVVGASVVVSDDPATARRLSAELDAAAEVRSLASVLAEPPSPEGRTVFKAMGLGLADVGVGAAVLRLATAHGRGRPIPHPEKAVPRWFAGGNE